jgi:uncharacterized protein YecT (DUF1311 family)
MTCGSLYADPQNEDPIDIAMEKAMEKNPSTAGVVQAVTQADEEWQKEIDAALTKLKTQMTPEQWKALQASQQAWQAYRDKEIETQDALYAVMQGTMWVSASVTKRMKLNKERALLLRDYIDTLSER